MPLSEHEQRVLEQIERALYADDPKFAATVRGIDPRKLLRRRFVRAALGVLLGLALLPVGIAIQHIEITLAGFLLSLLSAWYGVSAWRRAHSPVPVAAAAPVVTHHRWAPLRRRASSTAGPASTSAPSRGQRPSTPKRELLQRIEDRWNRRREGGFGS